MDGRSQGRLCEPTLGYGTQSRWDCMPSSTPMELDPVAQGSLPCRDATLGYGRKESRHSCRAANGKRKCGTNRRCFLHTLAARHECRGSIQSAIIAVARHPGCVVAVLSVGHLRFAPVVRVDVNVRSTDRTEPRCGSISFAQWSQGSRLATATLGFGT